MKTIAQMIDDKLGNVTKHDTIVEALGGFSGETIASVLARNEYEADSNPLNALAIDFDISGSTDLLGKYVTDLQTGMAVDAKKKVSGTSKYVDDYTGFSSDEVLQKGNFCAFHVSVGELVIGTNVTVKVNGVNLDPDGIFIMRFIAGSKNPKARVTVSADGHDTVVKTYDFTSVVREAAEEE